MNPVIDPDGVQRWYENGVLHRLDGPAIINPYGVEIYYQNGVLHRLGGPAYTDRDGYREYWENDQYHRLDGPAIIFPNGEQRYYVNGEIPVTIHDLIITDREMIFDATPVGNIRYDDSRIKAYRFDDPDELALAILYYS